ncbi:MAG: class I SAM-dependent methyltransferase [Bacteroidota bacterium]
MTKREIIFSGAVAENYDLWFATPAGRYAGERENELLLRFVRIPNRGMLLDVGCGTGIHLALFSRHGLANGVGIDISMEMLQIAKRKPELRMCSFVVADATMLPFRDGAFEEVVSITALEFVNQKLKALQEMMRVGQTHILLAVLNSLSLSSMLRKIRAWFRGDLFSKATFLSPYALKRLLRNVSPSLRIRWRTVLLLFPLYVRFLQGFFKHVDRIATALCLPFGAFVVLEAMACKPEADQPNSPSDR